MNQGTCSWPLQALASVIFSPRQCDLPRKEFNLSRHGFSPIPPQINIEPPKWRWVSMFLFGRVSLCVFFFCGGVEGGSCPAFMEKLSPRPKVKCRNRPLLPKNSRPRSWLHENKNTGVSPNITPNSKDVISRVYCNAHKTPSYHILCQHHLSFGETQKKHW